MVWGINRKNPSARFCCRRRQEKKKGRKSQKGYISAIWGAEHLGPISTKIGRVEGAHDVIILSNSSFNIFRGFRSTGGQNLHCPTNFAGHRYNSAASTAQPVIYCWFYASLLDPLLWRRKTGQWRRSISGHDERETDRPSRRWNDCELAKVSSSGLYAVLTDPALAAAAVESAGDVKSCVSRSTRCSVLCRFQNNNLTSCVHSSNSLTLHHLPLVIPPTATIR